MTVMAVLKFSTAPKGFWPALAAPYIIENTLIMSTMGLPVRLRPGVCAGAGELGGVVEVAGAAGGWHGDEGHSDRALIGFDTVLRSSPASFAPLLTIEIFTEPAGSGQTRPGLSKSSSAANRTVRPRTHYMLSGAQRSPEVTKQGWQQACWQQYLADGIHPGLVLTCRGASKVELKGVDLLNCCGSSHHILAAHSNNETRYGY
jgi:hypothetical protein